MEPGPAQDRALRLNWPCIMSEAETAIAVAARERTGGNKVRASELLGIRRNWLRRLLDEHSAPPASARRPEAVWPLQRGPCAIAGDGGMRLDLGALYMMTGIAYRRVRRFADAEDALG